MSNDRWVVLGVAHPRADWFRELARWSTAAAVPVDFVKCVSVEEVRARLRSGRVFSAVLVGGNVIGLDRDLVDEARAAGAAIIVVEPVGARDWRSLGAAAVLPATFDRADLTTVLRDHAPTIRPTDPDPLHPHPADPPTWCGTLVAVTGTGGSGTSTVAMGLSQELARADGSGSRLVLADFARVGEQAMLHDARNLAPGVSELVEAHRAGHPTGADVRNMLFAVDHLGYHVLLGLRRHRDWTSLRPRAVEAAVDSLVRSHRTVVADVDADLEGEAETGSVDVEDRNVLARATLPRADIVVVTADASSKGVHALQRTVRGLVEGDVATDRIVRVLTRAPRSRVRVRELLAAVRTLGDDDPHTAGLAPPIVTPQRRDLDVAVRDTRRLPRAITAGIVDAVTERQAAVRRASRQEPHATEPAATEPERVVPGSLGSWLEEAG